MTEAELNAIDSDLSRASEAWVNEHGRKLVAEIRRLQVDNTTRAGYYARSHSTEVAHVTTPDPQSFTPDDERRAQC